MTQPPLSPEEKAKKLEAQRAKKRAAYHRWKEKHQLAQPKQALEFAKPQISPAEQSEIDRIERIMAAAHLQRLKQNSLPREEIQKVGNREIIRVAPVHEYIIGDEPQPLRPDFVRRDEDGWEEAE